MTFRITADVTFEAEDIDDAFRVLAEHFHTLFKSGLQATEALGLGVMTIEPVPKEGPTSLGVGGQDRVTHERTVS